jgi:hypothetical protein
MRRLPAILCEQKAVVGGSQHLDQHVEIGGIIVDEQDGVRVEVSSRAVSVAQLETRGQRGAAVRARVSAIHSASISARI